MTDNLELEKTLWQAANKLRNNMDAAENKHVILGLIFIKYISDTFDELNEQFKATEAETGADTESIDKYTAEHVFYVPTQAPWKWHLTTKCKRFQKHFLNKCKSQFVGRS